MFPCAAVNAHCCAEWRQAHTRSQGQIYIKELWMQRCSVLQNAQKNITIGNKKNHRQSAADTKATHCLVFRQRGHSLLVINLIETPRIRTMSFFSWPRKKFFLTDGKE